jgi:predicted ester cyclase
MFPDFEPAFDPVFTGDDVLCGRWTPTGTHEGDIPSLGVEPTGRSVECSGLFIDRIEDGRVVEMWHVSDLASLMEQLGEIPA